MGNVYGYVRISSMVQNEDRQLIVMKNNNVPKGNLYIYGLLKGTKSLGL